MRVELRDVSKGQALSMLSLAYDTGRAAIVLAETEQRPAVLGLIASGRMRPDSGTVTVDGREDGALLRRRVALVDAPDVCDPAPDVTVAGVVAEELMFAGRVASPLAARAWLDAHDARDLARTPIGDVQPSRRIRLLLELASLRIGVEALVLVSPDRHGGDPHHWWDVVDDFGARGFGVLVVAGAASAAVLADRAPRAELQPEVEPQPEVETEPEHEPEPEPEHDEEDPR